MNRIVLTLSAIAALLIAGLAGKGGSSVWNLTPGDAAIAATPNVTSVAGVKVTRPVPHAVESLGDIQSAELRSPRKAEKKFAKPFRRIRKQGDADARFFTPQLHLQLAPTVSSLFAPAPASMAPALDGSFAGLGNPTMGDVIPPDTMGAAGPNHLVSILNSDFAVFSKSGIQSNRVTLDAFWLPLGVTTAHNPFDPRALFDQHSGRFIAISIGGTGGTESWLLLGVSQTSDPTGTWNMVAIDADLDNNAQQFTNEADFPDLGVDGSYIYITANMFNGSNYQYSKAWAVPKAQMLGGSPPDTLEFFEFRAPPGSGSTMRPAHTFGMTPGGVEYIVFEGGSSLIHLAGIVPGTPPTWNDLGNVPVNTFLKLSDISGVPQLGIPNSIDAGDTRLLNAVYRNGWVWTTHHVASGGKTEVAWYRIDPGTLTAADQGRISHASRWFVYPSIAVNQANDVAIGFSGSSSTEYISAYYTARRGSDAPGTMQPVTLLKSGENPYFKTGATLGGTATENRWGDYSATSVDPVDDTTFWTIQEYAETPSGGRSMWGTWWGRFQTSAVNPPTGLTATTVSTSQIDLGWTDSSNETGYVVERRLHPAGEFSPIVSLGANSTSYVDNTGLAAGNTYYYRVQAFDAAGGSYSNDAFAPTITPPPPSSGGGGGGGCSIAKAPNANEDVFSFAGVIVLQFLPLAYLAWRRRSRRGSTR